ncbi:hypothetical protein Taro_025528 [Colocasia esculenta]|uniref:Uncharacterized protein n=1 Tax=Colocasia esculenta TaxID=4460 RepID=A0A843VGV3_COLES|nr:hypothetical protein [Colocasia esculenta]
MTREAPKRLLTLAHILDEYVSLKGQRIAVEQEKRRVEALLGGIQDAVNAYRSGSEPHPPLPSPPQMSPPAPPPTPAVVPAPVPSGRIASANPGNRYRTGPLVPQIPLVRSLPVVVPSKVPQASSISPPLGNNTRSNKRKNPKPVLKAPAAPKKHRGQSQADVSALEGTRGPSESDGANRTEQPVHQKSPACNLPSNSDRNPDPFVERSSVAKSPSVQSPDSDINSTPPKTPQQACSSQSQKMVPFLASSSSCQSASGSASKELTPSKCSITSSKTVVVSPYKKECYYTVQKSCRITSSPLKASPRRAGIRDCVKSRLDFDDSDLPSACENPALAGSPNSLIDDKLDDIFNFDISDFDMDFSFAELLVNGDLDCGEFTGSCQPAIKSSADSISRSEEAAANACLGMSQDVPVPCLTSMSGVMSEEAMRVTEVGTPLSSPIPPTLVRQ